MATIVQTPSGSVIQTNNLGAQSSIDKPVIPTAPNPNIGNQSNVRTSPGLVGDSNTLMLATTLPYPLPEHEEENDVTFDGTVDFVNIVFARKFGGIPSLKSLDFIMTNATDPVPPYMTITNLTVNGATIQAGAAVAMTVHYKFSRREG